MKVAYFGLPLGALLLDADGHDLVFVGLSRKDVGIRRAERRFGARLVYKPDVDDPALRARLAALAPQLVVSWFWTTRLPMSLIGVAPLGGVGVHPSLLPRHRGPDPTAWAIFCGDRETGVTAHRLAAAYDTGDVLDQEALVIDDAWTAWHLAKALDRPSLRLLRKTVSRFAAGEAIAAMPQDEALATEAPFFDDAAAAIRWTDTTARVLRQVRALAPAPGAWTPIGDAAVVITRAETVAQFPRALEPGEGARVGGRAVVRTGDGAVALLEGEIDGEAAGAAALAALFP